MAVKEERALLDKREAEDAFTWIEGTDLYSYFVITKQNYTCTGEAGFLQEINPEVVYLRGSGRRVQATFVGAGRRAKRIFRGFGVGGLDRATENERVSPGENELDLVSEQNRKNSHQNSLEGGVPIDEREVEEEYVIDLGDGGSESGEPNEHMADHPVVPVDPLGDLEAAESQSQDSFDQEDRYFTKFERFCSTCGHHSHTYRYCTAPMSSKCLNCMGNHFQAQCPSINCKRCHETGHIDKHCPISLRQMKSVKCPVCGLFGHLKDCRTLADFDRYHPHFDFQDLRCIACGEFGHFFCEK